VVTGDAALTDHYRDLAPADLVLGPTTGSLRRRPYNAALVADRVRETLDLAT
jgi:hypothetical protein